MTSYYTFITHNIYQYLKLPCRYFSDFNEERLDIFLIKIATTGNIFEQSEFWLSCDHYNVLHAQIDQSQMVICYT